MTSRPEFCSRCRELLLVCECEPDDDMDQDHCQRCGHLLADHEYRMCDDCTAEERKFERDHQNCICWPTDFSGRSVCGVLCPVHRREGDAAT